MSLDRPFLCTPEVTEIGGHSMMTKNVQLNAHKLTKERLNRKE